MNPTDTVRLARLVKAACPNQQIDEYTADIWHGLLEDIRVEDAIDAVKNLGRNQQYIAPADVRAEVRRIRGDRLDRIEVPPPPPEWADDYAGWLRHARKLIADGREVELPAAVEGTKRDVAGLLEQAFGKVS